MKVSVVIPVYNGEKYIKNSIQSALNQSYRDIEVIVIDDCSTDATKEVIFTEFKEYINRNVFYYKNDKNMERSYSRNKGVEVAKGKIVFFLDYDDEWEYDYIEKSITYFDNYDIVYSFPRTLIDENGKVVKVSRKNISKDDLKVIFSGQIGYPSATGFKKSSFLGYREDVILREDWEIFIRSYLNKIKIKVIDNNKVKIREHSNRTSKNIKMLYSTLKIYQDYKDSVPKNYRGEFLFHIADICMRFGDLKNGWSILISSLKEDPSIITDKRKILSIIKRGFRVDRYIKNSILKI